VGKTEGGREHPREESIGERQGVVVALLSPHQGGGGGVHLVAWIDDSAEDSEQLHCSGGRRQRR
jgi:hypothetical protein